MINVGVAQSGGPTSAINATLAGVLKGCSQSAQISHVYGFLNGIEGVLKLQAMPLNSLAENEESMAQLIQTPSAFLGSCRYKLPTYQADEALYQQIIRNLKSLNIDVFLYIGGNDSMDTVEKLQDYVSHAGIAMQIIGIPKTIDNDLFGTDHTPGFGSAAKYVASTVTEIIRDSYTYAVESVAIVEIMGRNAGWLTAASALGRCNGEVAPHLIYLPERPFHTDTFLADTRDALHRHKAVVIAIAEGVTPVDVTEEFRREKKDAFSHRYLSGIGKLLETKVSEEIGCKVRSIELNVPQRCAGHLLSKTDIEESLAIGSAAVEKALEGATGCMMVFRRIANNPYSVSIETMDIRAVSNKERLVPPEWISPDGNDIEQPLLDYLFPLIQGEWPVQMKSGLPVHLVRRGL